MPNTGPFCDTAKLIEEQIPIGRYGRPEEFPNRRRLYSVALVSDGFPHDSTYPSTLSDGTVVLGERKKVSH